MKPESRSLSIFIDQNVTVNGLISVRSYGLPTDKQVIWKMRILNIMQVFAGVVLVVSYVQMAQAGQSAAASWTEKKCRLFTNFSIENGGEGSGLGQDFLTRQNRFIQSGCVARIHVCPTSPAELDYANRMSILMINEGATGSFLPFLCDQQ
jgi:hypothetical protein